MMWDMHNRTTKKQAEKNRKANEKHSHEIK
jgi:hypothetical protein